MQKNNSFYLLVLLSLLFGFLVLLGCFTLYTQEGFEEGKDSSKPLKKEKDENNLDEKNEKKIPEEKPDKEFKKPKNSVKKIKVKTLPF